MLKFGNLAQRPALRFTLLALVWLLSYAIYYLVFVRSYSLAAYLATPRLSTGVIDKREAGPAGAFILGFVALFALYAIAYRLCRGWRAGSVVATIGLLGLVLALLLVQVYPIGANDLFGYITSGELLAFYRLNPMVYPASHVPNLPFMQYSAYAQVQPNYGPVWTWIEGAVAWVVGKPDLMGLTLGFKAVEVLAYIAACVVLVLVLRRRAPDQVAAGLIVLAWNPIVLFEVGVNGHNDIWIGLFLLLGVLFWETRHWVWMAVAITLAALIKVPVAPLLPLFFIAAWRLEPDAPHRRRLLLSCAVAVLAVVAGSYLSLPQGLKGVANLQSRTDLFTHSLPAVVRLTLGLFLPQKVAMLIAGAATLALFGSYCLLQLANAWRTPAEAVRLGFNVILFLLLLCMSWFQPWYLLWVVPLAAAYPRPNAPFQVGLFALCASWSYIVYGFVWFWLPKIANWGRALGIELMALISTYALSWEYTILSAIRREDAISPRRTP